MKWVTKNRPQEFSDKLEQFFEKIVVNGHCDI